MKKLIIYVFLFSCSTSPTVRQSSVFLEQSNQRTLESKTWKSGNQFTYQNFGHTVHWQDTLGGSFNEMDFKPTKIGDTWHITQNEFHYSLKENGQWGFGGRQGAHFFKFRLVRLGYLHYPTRAWEDISGSPTYALGQLANVSDSLVTSAGKFAPTNLKVEWRNIWNTPGGGEVWLDVRVSGRQLKIDVVLNEIGRDWIVANRPPSTALGNTYFGLVFKVNWDDIPKIIRNGIIKSSNDDFDDADSTGTELKDSLDRLLAFMPLDYAFAGAKDLEEKIQLRKRFWEDTENQFGGGNFLFVGAKVGQINSLPARDIRFDPTFGPDQIAADDRDGQEVADTQWNTQGHDNDGNRVGNASEGDNDMGMAWPNVTVPQGATISSCTIEVFMKFKSGTSDIVTRMQGFDVDDVAVFSSTNRPSQIAQTSALVDRTYDDINDFVDETFLSLDDASAIIQEIVDRGSWASGNALGVVLKENGSASEKRWQFQDYGRSNGDAAKITIVYTETVATPATKKGIKARWWN